MYIQWVGARIAAANLQWQFLRHPSLYMQNKKSNFKAAKQKSNFKLAHFFCFPYPDLQLDYFFAACPQHMSGIAALTLFMKNQ